MDRLRIQRDQARTQVDELENLLTESRHQYLRVMCGISEPVREEPSNAVEEGRRWREDLMRPVVKAAVAVAQSPSPESWRELQQAVKTYEGRD
jgi:hypothetical protein